MGQDGMGPTGYDGIYKTKREGKVRNGMGAGTMLKLGVTRAIFNSFLSMQRYRANVKFRPKLWVLCLLSPPPPFQRLCGTRSIGLNGE